MKRVYYDALGKELKVGAVVAVPNWNHKTMEFGRILQLNIFNDYAEDFVLHRVEFYADGKKYKGDWKEQSIVTLHESDATLLTLQDFEPRIASR